MSQGNKRKAALPPHLRIITSDELGMLKVSEVPAGPKWDAASVVQCWGQPARDRSVQAITSSVPINDAPEQAFALVANARNGGSVEVLSSCDGSVVGTIPHASSSTEGKDSAVNVVALAFRYDAAHESNSNIPDLVTCTSTGLVRVHRQPASSSDEQPSTSQPWQQIAAFQTCAAAATQPGTQVLCMALDAAGDTVAVGGEGCHLQLWSLSSQQELFRAKGGKPNKVGLVDLPHVTAITFLPPAKPGEQQRVLVGTAQHKLWLYEPSVGKRPQLEVSWDEAKITSLAPERNGQRVWVANGLGNVMALNLQTGKMEGALKGAAGSVRTLALSPQDPGVLASVGLDRYLRLYDTDSRKCLSKVYLKQQLTGVAFVPVAAAPQEDGAEAGDQEEQGEEEGHNDVDTEKAKKSTAPAHKHVPPKHKQRKHKKQRRDAPS